MTDRNQGQGEILPCPFCEGEAELIHGYPDGLERWWVRCRTCDIATKPCAQHQIVVSEWSTRAQVAALRGERDEALSGESAAKSEADHLRKLHECRQCGGTGLTHDPESGGDFCERCAIGREMMAQAEVAECDRISDRMRELLTETAAALKGPPGELMMHDWSDLPAKAVELKAERDQALARVGWAENWNEEARRERDELRVYATIVEKACAATKAKLAEAEKDNKELGVICHGMGYASRNDEVRALQAKLAEAKGRVGECEGLLEEARSLIAVEDNASAYEVRDRIDAALGRGAG